MRASIARRLGQHARSCATSACCSSCQSHTWRFSNDSSTRDFQVAGVQRDGRAQALHGFALEPLVAQRAGQHGVRAGDSGLSASARSSTPRLRRSAAWPSAQPRAAAWRRAPAAPGRLQRRRPGAPACRRAAASGTRPAGAGASTWPGLVLQAAARGRHGARQSAPGGAGHGPGSASTDASLGAAVLWRWLEGTRRRGPVALVASAKPWLANAPGRRPGLAVGGYGARQTVWLGGMAGFRPHLRPGSTWKAAHGFGPRRVARPGSRPTI
jgi:hypothetical protein